MKKRITGLVMLLFLLVAFSAVLYAEVFQSEIKSVNGNEITVVKKDPATGEAGSEEFQVQTSRKTKLKNFASLEELRPGDEVKVNAKWHDKQSCWMAKSLLVSKVEIRQ